MREWRRDGSTPPWSPNYAPGAHTVRNDYGACFVDSGLVTPPSAWVPTSDACAAEHPKRRRLLDLKAALVQASAIPRTYLQADVRTWLDPHASLGVLDGTGMPRHDRGVSTALPGLAFLGLEFQRSFSSNTLRGVHRDAQHVVDALSTLPRGAAVA